MHLALFVLATLIVAAYLFQLARLVRSDRSAYPPRSHSHEVDPVARPFAQVTN